MELVSVDTENPPGRGLAECADVLRAAMDRLGLAPEVIELPPSGTLEDPRIVRGSAGDGPRTIYFHGHFDVVPAQRRDQFTPERRDGRITGRGTADMKGGLVSMLYGAVAARELGLLDGTTHRPASRVRRGDRQHGRLRPPARARADRPAGAGDAHARADRRGRLAREPRRDHDARLLPRARGARRPGGAGRQRLRAHGPRRRAALRARARAARPRLDARRRRRGGRRRELQRRARRGVVLARPPLQPGRGARGGGRAPDRCHPRTPPATTPT